MKYTLYHTLAVGITGGIGSGKTEVCKIFERFGAKILYSDLVAKTIADTNETVRSRIKKEFGGESYLPDGTLDRQRMAKLVFQDEQLKEKLNAIIHPVVLEHIKKEIHQAKSEHAVPLFCVEAALIFEAKAEKMFDYLVVVDVPEELRIERIMKRDSISRTEVEQRINAQLQAKEKTSKADFVIYNTGDIKVLEHNCAFVFNLLTILSMKGS